MKKRLMVVDDSRVMELQICKLLENSKYEVVAYCENGEEAIARYEDDGYHHARHRWPGGRAGTSGGAS